MGVVSTKPGGHPITETLGDWVINERAPFVSGEEWERSLREAFARWAHVLYPAPAEDSDDGE